MNTQPRGYAFLAAGFTTAFGTLQTNVVKQALDFQYYTYHIDLYVPINLIVCVGMIAFQVLAAGTLLTKIKINNGSHTQ